MTSGRNPLAVLGFRWEKVAVISQRQIGHECLRQKQGVFLFQ